MAHRRRNAHHGGTAKAIRRANARADRARAKSLVYPVEVERLDPAAAQALILDRLNRRQESA